MHLLAYGCQEYAIKCYYSLSSIFYFHRFEERIFALEMLDIFCEFTVNCVYFSNLNIYFNETKKTPINWSTFNLSSSAHMVFHQICFTFNCRITRQFLSAIQINNVMNECQQKCSIFIVIISFQMRYADPCMYAYTSNHVLQHSVEPRKRLNMDKPDYVMISSNGILAFNWFPYRLVHNLLRGHLHNVQSIATELYTHFVLPFRSWRSINCHLPNWINQTFNILFNLWILQASQFILSKIIDFH